MQEKSTTATFSTENYTFRKSNKICENSISKRVGKPSDIAKACLYLTDSENDFVTGENLIVDGGMTRKMIYE